MNLDNQYIFEGKFGIERETLRINADGTLAQTPHPFSNDKYFTRDFCENQLELVTPVCAGVDKLFSVLGALDAKVREKLLKSDEYIWLNSNPPRFDSEDDIPIAEFNGAQAFKREYRAKLEGRYGKRLMLYSGIHLNISFSDRLLHSICECDKDFRYFKNSLYFRLFKQINRYSWLFVLLTAASPVYDLSLDIDDNVSGTGFDGYGSRRSGEKGYWNKFVPIMDYTDLYTYTQSVKKYIDEGKLFSEGELYMPARIKPSGNNSLASLSENGADYIELRMFDLNPLSPVGIFRADVEFAHYFLIYLLSLPDFDFNARLQKDAIKNHKAAARYDLTTMKIDDKSAKGAALEILEDMSRYFCKKPAVLKNIRYQRKKLTENRRYCVSVYKNLSGDFNKKMLCISKGNIINSERISC